MMSGIEMPYSSAVHWKVGRSILTTLNDGYFQMPMEQFLTGIPPVEIERAQHIAMRERNERININAYLIRSEEHVPILIDAGLGSGMVPSAGRLLEALRSVGVSTDEIGTILLTHLHGDHCCGLVDESGNAIYPNAEIVISAAEAAYWLGEHEERSMDENAVALARTALKPYQDRIRLIDQGEVMPGISALPLPGHTPGHTGYQLEDGGDSVLIWGDVVNVPAVQSLFPQAGVVSDVDPLQAAETRRKMLKKAAQENLLIAGMHTEFPGLVRVTTSNEGFRLVPASWIERQW